MTEFVEIFFDVMLFFAYYYMGTLLLKVIKIIDKHGFWEDDNNEKKN